MSNSDEEMTPVDLSGLMGETMQPPGPAGTAMGFIGGKVPDTETVGASTQINNGELFKRFDSSKIVVDRINPWPAWTQDEAFMRIVLAGMPAIYERYKDPKNRAKGEPGLDGSQCFESLGDLVEECVEVLLEYVKHRKGNGDPEKILYETGDVALTALRNAATWSKVVEELM